MYEHKNEFVYVCVMWSVPFEVDCSLSDAAHCDPHVISWYYLAKPTLLVCSPSVLNQVLHCPEPGSPLHEKLFFCEGGEHGSRLFTSLLPNQSTSCDGVTEFCDQW